MTTWVVECQDCFERTEYDNEGEARDAEWDECGACSSQTGAVLALTPCPNGATAQDWRDGVWQDKCQDETHEPRTGMHVEREDS